MSYWSDRYKRLRKQGLCTQCGVTPTNGKSRCKWCAEKAKVARKSLTNEQLSAQRMKEKQRYYDLKEKGLCVTCGKKPAKTGCVRCEECLKYITEKRKQSESKKWEL